MSLKLISDTKNALRESAAISMLGFVVTGNSDDLDRLLKMDKTLNQRGKLHPVNTPASGETGQTAA